MVGWTLDAVDAARHDARNRSLSRTSLARKDIAMSDALLRNGIFQRGLNVLLVDHVGKSLGPVLPRYDLIHSEGNAEPRVIRGT